jgi:hypothetical protein
MSNIRVHHNNRKRVGLGFEEEKAWRGFYQRYSNPDVAIEILKELDADDEMKRAHLALYMCCKESLRTAKSRQARNQRIGQFVRWLADKVCMTPWQVIKGWLRGSRDVAVECLPEVRKEPAARQVERLGKEGEFAQAKTAFDGQAETVATAPAAAPANTPAPAVAAAPARSRVRAPANANASVNKTSS